MIAFHRFLIGTAILFCIVFAYWSFAGARGGEDLPRLLLGVAFAVAAVALGYYLRHLSRFLGRR